MPASDGIVLKCLSGKRTYVNDKTITKELEVKENER